MNLTKSLILFYITVFTIMYISGIMIVIYDIKLFICGIIFVIIALIFAVLSYGIWLEYYFSNDERKKDL